jgi:peptidoglycan/LPS O-acetylase OafA/YrhL
MRFQAIDLLPRDGGIANALAISNGIFCEAQYGAKGILFAGVSRTQQLGTLIILVGVVAALLAALADPLGIGDFGFGWKQILLLAVGIVLIVAGGVMVLRTPRSAARASSVNRH